MIRIRLVDGVEGYLDIKEGSNFPINMGISEIRDISKRSGLFSKTITLVGNKNNNRLLGSLYDVNIVAGTYNINKLQKCQVIDGGEVILDNLYFQLIGVTKISNNINDEQFVEYQAVIKDTVSDFFTKIGQRELSDIDFSDFDYTPAGARRLLTKSEVTSSFDNTILDGFKFVLPWLDPNRKTAAASNPSNTYQLREINPAIYAKIYFDRIFSGAGYRYTWNDLTDLDIRFDKLLIPYNGDEKQILSGVQEQYEVNLSSPNFLQLTTSPSPMLAQANAYRIYRDTLHFTTEIKDLEDQWDTTLEKFTTEIGYNNINGLEVEFVFDYELALVNNEVEYIRPYSSNADNRNDMLIFPSFRIFKDNDVTDGVWVDTHLYGDALENGFVFPYSQLYAPGVTVVKTDTISIKLPISYFKYGKTLSDFVAGIGNISLKENNPFSRPFWVKNSNNGLADMRYRATFTNCTLNFKPALGAIDYRIPIVMNGYVPKKVKQVDFIKSIAQLYNLYFEPDKYDKGNIIIKTRDDYYDSGEILDWTNKQVKDKETNIQFLPELTSKSLILSYKEDKDYANTVYKDATKEVYGELKWTFDNEYVKGEDRKELIFSPTPVSLTSFGAVMPVLNGFNPNNNIRILLDNGSEGRNYYIEENGSTLSSNIVPIISHLGGNQLQPDFDINYGLCSYYFYQFVKTNNNLGNLHWRRTLNQINSGKLLTTLFNLNTSDVRTLRLNSKIRINNSYWNINKVIDFDANSKAPTKVELISIDVNTDLGNFFDRNVSEPVNGEGIVNINSNWQIESRNGFSNNVNVIGYNNSIEPTTTGYITGDNNIFIAQSNSPIIVSGDNNIVKADAVTIFGYNNDVESGSTFITGASNSVAPGLNGVTILGSNITATTSNTTYTENIIMTPGSTLNGVPVNEVIVNGAIDILYTDLFNLTISSLLIPGQIYKITDFQTIYDQPDYDSGGAPKTPLTLTGTNIPLYVKAYNNVTLYDKVVYYKPSVVEAIYNIGWNATEINGTPMKGRITYLKDIWGNESPFDHTEILLKRYETINGSGVYDSYKDTGFGSSDINAIFGYDNKCGTQDNWSDFWLPNNLINGYSNILYGNNFNNTILGDGNKLGVYSDRNLISGRGNNIGILSIDNTILSNYNYIGNSSINNNIGINSTYNKIGDSSNNNNIGNNSLNNKIGNGSNDNIIGNGCTENILGDLCILNVLNNNSYNNKLDRDCQSNIFNGISGDNTFGASCLNNNLTDCLYNIFGSSCEDNVLDTCSYNTFGDVFNNNTITPTSYFEYNTFDDDCKDNVLEGSWRGNVIGNKFNTNTSDVTAVLQNNIIGDVFQNSSFSGTQIVGNRIGNLCDDITFNINSLYNIIGDKCTTIIFNGNNRNIEIANESSTLTFQSNVRDVKILQFLQSRIFTTADIQKTFDKDKYNIAASVTTTTNTTPTTLYSFIPNGDGVYSLETITMGIDNASGDSIVSKQFAAFKVIGGVVTQISTTTTDRKSNFAAAIQTELITDGTNIIIRVTGKAATTINWNGHITITK